MTYPTWTRPPRSSAELEREVTGALTRAVERNRVAGEFSARVALHEAAHAVMMVELGWAVPSIETRAWGRGEGATHPAPGQTAPIEDQLIVVYAGEFGERLAFQDCVGNEADERHAAQLLAELPPEERAQAAREARGIAEKRVQCCLAQIRDLALALEERDNLSAAEVRKVLRLDLPSVVDEPVAAVRAAAAAPPGMRRVELRDGQGRPAGHRLVELRNAASYRQAAA